MSNKRIINTKILWKFFLHFLVLLVMGQNKWKIIDEILYVINFERKTTIIFNKLNNFRN